MAKEKEVKDAKFKVIDDAIAGLEKTYGKGTIMRLGDKPIQNYDVISTGCLSLDFAIGVGGVPKGRIIEVFGPFASGKSSMALHIVAESQKQGGEAAFVDVEHALDLKYAKKLGVDTSRLLLSQPDFAEQALEIVTPHFMETLMNLKNKYGFVEIQYFTDDNYQKQSNNNNKQWSAIYKQQKRNFDHICKR